MRLVDLEPTFLKREDDTHFKTGVSRDEADGVMFLCPKCFMDDPAGPVGTHPVVCWAPGVPQTTHPIPGRWSLVGTGFDDLSLVAGSSSIKLTTGCMWHGFVTNGEVTL